MGQTWGFTPHAPTPTFRARSTKARGVMNHFKAFSFLFAAVCLGACSSAPPDAVNSSFDFTTQAFTFTNFDNTQSGGDMTAALAARMFGDAVVCSSGTQENCQPTAAAKAWIEEVNATLDHGHSEGMAVLSLLMSLGKVDPKAFGADSAAALGFDNYALRAELAYWAATQKILSVHAGDKKFAPNAVIPFLATALSDKKEAWRLLIAIRDESGYRAGHAVVPFGYFKGSAPNQYFIRIYDSNFPGEERRIELDVQANTWKYEGSPNPDVPRTYTGGADNPLMFSPVSARLGLLVPPFSEGFAASTSQGVLLVNGEGIEVGLKDGKVVEKGGSLVPGAADCFCKAPNGISNVMISGTGSRTVAIGADAGTVYATSPTVSAKVEGGNGSGGVTIDPSKKTVTYNTTSDAGTSITTTTKNADGSQTTVTVTVDKPSTAVTVDASDPANVKVTADVSTSETKVSITTTVTQADGTSTTTNAQGTTKGGNDATFTVNAVDGGSTVNTNVNYATCLNGKKDPMESDLDCGAFCSTQAEKRGAGLCSIGATCTQNSDCEAPTGSNAGECFGGKCSSHTCSDNRKNGFETSVDCGGGCPCSAGFSCTSGAGCRPGLECHAALCEQPKAPTVTVVGLGSDAFVRFFITRDGQPETFLDVTGQAGGATFSRTFLAITSFSARVSADSHVVCSFDQANAQGLWTWTSTQSPQPPPNTLRCRRVKTDVAYNTQGTGCPSEIERTPTGSSVRVWERLPAGPLLSVSASHPSISLLSTSASVEVQRISSPFIWQGLHIGLDGGVYDGGLAYSLNVGGQVTGTSTYRYSTNSTAQINALNMKPRTYTYGCSITGPLSGPVPTGALVAPLACYCVEVVDGGAVVVDSGTPDAGPADSGAPDAGPADAGPADAGPPDAGAPMCTLDSNCAVGADCYCGANSGNCTGNTGRCGAGKFVAATPTSNGIAPSGTFTVPAGCNQVRIVGWGAAGGKGVMGMFGPPSGNEGGAGGFISGLLSTTPGEVFTVWVGQAGDLATNATANQGQGSYLGTQARGGLGHSMGFNQPSGGSGGGLTSIKHAQGNGTTIQTMTIPAGGGGGANQPADNAGASGSGTHSTRSGQDAPGGSTSGGGGAGENGGTASSGGTPGLGGGFGALPGSITSVVGPSMGVPGGESLPDNSNLCVNAGRSAGIPTPGNGCVVIRCVQ